MASDSTETLTREEAKRILRRLELEAYAGIVTAFRAQGDLDRTKKQALQDLAGHLSISTERHKAEIRRAVSDDQLNAVAECINGPSSEIAWSAEGRRLISMMPRLVPQTALTAKATVAANATQVENVKLRRRLASSPADAKLKMKGSNPNGMAEVQSPIVQPMQKIDVFNNNINSGANGENVKANDIRSPDAEKVKKKKRHPTASRIQPPKLNPAFLSNKAISKAAIEGYKPTSSLPMSVSPSKASSSNFPKFHSKPIILQRSSPFKPSHHAESGFGTSSSIVTSTTGVSTPTIPASTFSISTRPTITSFTTSPSGGLIPVQYNSVSGISAGLSPSKVKFKAPMPRQRGKPSKFKTIGPSSRSVPLASSSVASDPMNVLATPTGIPITPISPNKTQVSPVSTIPALSQSSPCTVKVVQLPKSTASVSTPPSQGISINKIAGVTSSTSSTKTPAQRVLTFSNLPGHSGQQLKIASIPNVLQQSGALASTAKLVSISKSVPMATGFKMIAVTTMVPGSSQVKTVYIATPIMSLTKSVTHGTGSIISTSVHNRKRVASTSSTPGVSSSGAFSSIDITLSKISSSTSSSGNISVLSSAASASLSAALTSKTVSSILASSNQLGKEKDLLVISPVTSNTSKPVSTTSNDRDLIASRPTSTLLTSAAPSVRIPSEPTSLLAKQINEKLLNDQGITRDKDLLSAGDTFIANLAAKFSTTGHTEASTNGKQFKTTVSQVTDADSKSTITSSVSSTLISHEKESPPIDLSARETLDGDDHGTPTSSFSTNCSSSLVSVTGSGKNSVMFLSSEDGIWSSSNTLCKSEASVITAKKIQGETQNSVPKKAPLAAKSNATSNCITSTMTTSLEPSNSPVVCRCKIVSSPNTLTVSTKESVVPSTQIMVQQSVKNLISSSLDSNSLSSPDKKKQKLIHIPSIKGEKFNHDTKTASGGKQSQKVELLSGERKSFNKFIPIQNQTKEISPGPSSVDSSHYTSTLRDLNKLFFNQFESNASERKNISDGSDGKSATSNGPIGNDMYHYDSTQTSKGKVVTSPKLSDSTSSNDSNATNTSSSIESDMNLETDERFNSHVTTHDTVVHGSHQTGKKRKYSDGKDPNQRYQSGWVRSAQLSERLRDLVNNEGDGAVLARERESLLQKVSRYRGSNKQKGEMNASSWFARPVDPDDAPNYYKIIKSPMDFSTIKGKLEDGSYRDYTEFFADMQLIKINCHTYNPPEHPARKDCDDVFSFFEVEYKKTLERWQRCHVSPTKKMKGASNALTEEVSSKT